MTPTEKLKVAMAKKAAKISNDWRFGDPKSAYKCGARLHCKDILYLVKELKKISKEFGTDYADGNTMIAHDALAEIYRKYGVEI